MLLVSEERAAAPGNHPKQSGCGCNADATIEEADNKMNTATIELNMNELEMANGGFSLTSFYQDVLFRATSLLTAC